MYVSAYYQCRVYVQEGDERIYADETQPVWVVPEEAESRESASRAAGRLAHTLRLMGHDVRHIEVSHVEWRQGDGTYARHAIDHRFTARQAMGEP